MEKDLIINGEKYILESTIDYNKNIANIGVMDSGKVCLLIQVLDSYKDGDIITIPKPEFVFKKNGELSDCKLNFERTRLYTKEGTIIGYEWYEMATRLFKLLTYSRSTKALSISIYELYDRKSGTFKKDSPILLNYGQYALVIAPRIEDE